MNRRHCTWLFLAPFLLPLAAGVGCRPPLVLQPPSRDDEGVTRLFDGQTLDGWRLVDQFDFQEHGRVEVLEGALVLHRGSPGTGVVYTGEVPRVNFQLTLQASRREGSDFFCGLTFPVADSHCTLVVGGWGGTAVGLSNIDGMSAIENETTSSIEFRPGQWYDIRVLVTNRRLAAWVGDEQIADLEVTDRRFSIWWEQEPLRPLGIATWYTTGAVRNLQLQRLAAE